VFSTCGESTRKTHGRIENRLHAVILRSMQGFNNCKTIKNYYQATFV
jgi:hypothetical protein